MTKPTAEFPPPSPQPASAASPWTVLGLQVTAILAALLALFQWMELIVAMQGGTTFCTLSAKLDCAQVWQSALAKGIQRLTSMPVAGWGLVWGAGAVAVTTALWVRLATGKAVDAAWTLGVRLYAATGLLAVVVLGGDSLMMGVFCVTCLTTYVIAIIFAVFAFRLPGPLFPLGNDVVSGGFLAAGPVALAYLLLLYPGSQTPMKPLSTTIPSTAQPARPAGPASSASSGGVSRPDPQDPLAALLSDLPRPALQAVADSLAIVKASPAPDTSAYPARFRMGPPNAPVRIVDFTDIRCGHCRHLNDEIHKIERLAPADSFSVEARHFPLDSECNPVVRATDGTGVRCAAARALICLEGKPGFWDTHTRLYEESERLTKARVLDLASQGGLARPELERCMASPETAVKLKADIDYAMLFNPEGTPLVLVNGRRATPVGPFLFALIVAGGRVDAPAFAVLPQPSLPGLAP